MTKEPVPPWKEVPSYQHIYPYLLLVLHQLGGEAKVKDVVIMLAERFQLSKKLIKKKMKAGGIHFYFNTAWARQGLKETGYLASDSPYGVWALSQEGREKIPDLTEWDTNKDKESLDDFREEIKLALKKKNKQFVEEPDEEMTEELVPPLTEIPPYKHIYPYLLLALHQLGGEAKARDVVARVAEIFQLSKRLIRKKMKAGGVHFYHNTTWARQGLKEAGYLASDSPGGVWILSRTGKKKIPDLTKWDINKDKESLDNFREEIGLAVKKYGAKKDKRTAEEPDKDMINEPVPPFTRVPSYRHIYPYLLLVLHQLGGKSKASDVVAKLVERFQLGGKLLEEKVKSGDSLFHHNTNWARLVLKKARYLASDSPYGVWALSQEGREKIPYLTEWDTNKDRQLLDNFREEVRLAAKKYGAEKTKRIVKEPVKEKQVEKEPAPPLTEVPFQSHIYPYLLLVLHQLGGEAVKRDVMDGLAEKFQLSKELLEQKTKGGKFHFYFNIAGARQVLKKTRYLASDSSYGVWALSKKGKKRIPYLTRWDTDRDKQSLDNFRKEVRQASKKKLVIRELDEQGTQVKKEPVPPWKIVPSHKHIYPYLLLILHQLGGEATKGDAIAKIAERLQLSKELSEKKTEAGRFYLHFNTAGARQDLKAAGYLVSNSSYGVWALSRRGREKVPELTRWCANRDGKSLDDFREKVRLAAAKKKTKQRTLKRLLKNATRR